MRNFSKLNTLLSSANILKTLPKNVVSRDLMTAFARFCWLEKLHNANKGIYVYCSFEVQADWNEILVKRLKFYCKLYLRSSSPFYC